MDLSKILPATLADVGQRQNAKPEPRKRTKARKERAEAKVKKAVRAECVKRDGFCRLMGCGPCSGRSEWAHLGEKKRARTRKMAPEVRHTTAGSLMACTGHHEAYDAGRIEIEPTTARGADGLLRVRWGYEMALAC